MNPKHTFITTLLIIQSYFFNSYDCANILFLLTVPSPSHTTWHRPLIQELGKLGHNITIANTYEDARGVAKGISNHTIIYFEGVVEHLWESIDITDMESILDMDEGNNLVVDYSVFASVLTMKTKGFQTLLNYPDNFFDVIVYDVLEIGTNFYPLLNKIGSKTPIVGTCPYGFFPYINTLMSEFAYPAIAPQNDGPVGTRMTFSQRLWSFLSYIQAFAHIKLNALPILKKEAENYFNDGKPYSDEEFYQPEERINAVLLNDDPFLYFPRPTSPTAVGVGGIHISKKVQPLPKDLQGFMDENKQGVILFSLGSNFDSGNMKEEKISAFLKVFRELPYGVIWKCEKKLEGLPKNIYMGSWLPIASILAHQNIKVFITHSGALSSQEAIYYGVPVVGIPLVVDQYHNIHLAMEKGTGEILPYKEISETTLRNVLLKVLNNPSYDQKAKKLSQLYRDQLNSPLEKAMFWINLSLKHGVVKELHLATKQLNIFQMYCLDVVLFLFVLLSISLWILKKVICTILRCFSGSKKKEKTA